MPYIGHLKHVSADIRGILLLTFCILCTPRMARFGTAHGWEQKKRKKICIGLILCGVSKFVHSEEKRNRCPTGGKQAPGNGKTDFAAGIYRWETRDI